MAKLEDLKKSITLMDASEIHTWLTNQRQSRRTPKIIHKKKTTKAKRTPREKKAKKITTRSGNKAVASLLTKEQKLALKKELLGL